MASGLRSRGTGFRLSSDLGFGEPRHKTGPGFQKFGIAARLTQKFRDKFRMQVSAGRDRDLLLGSR